MSYQWDDLISERLPRIVEPVFYVGLDLAQSKDYTALTIIECREGPDAQAVTPDQFVMRQLAQRAASQGYMSAPTDGLRYPRYCVRWLDRYRDEPYTQIVAKVLALLDSPQLRGKVRALCIDKTGVGGAVVDMFTAAAQGTRLVAITITAGDRANHEKHSQDYHVPKRELASVIQVVLQEQRLEFAGIPGVERLLNELKNFRVKISATGHDTYEAARESDHDDLVLSAAMAVWYAERGQPGIPLHDEWW